MFSLVDNRYRGEGFAFVIEDLANEDRWKYNFHGTYFWRDQAEAIAQKMNDAWDFEVPA